MRCGIDLFPETKKFFRKPSVRALDLPNQNSRVIIPIVFHVVGNSSVQSLLTENRINAQIKQLNRDFSMTNEDFANVPNPFKPWAATTAKISFELKQIVRKTTSQTSFQVPAFDLCQDPIKLTSLGGSNSIDTENNLNIWAGNTFNQTELDLLGYALFPWWRIEYPCVAAVDGVVIHHATVGSTSSPNPGAFAAQGYYNLGRTLTHEVGHYLGLYHMWYDCEDAVCCRTLPDLPAQKGPNRGRPSFPNRANSCPASPTSPQAQHGDMFMNYMDYVYDDTMFMFSESQIQSCIDSCVQYRPKMVKQFNSSSTSTLSLSGLTSTNNSDVYQCIVSTMDGKIISSDTVTVTTA
jgi:hypothetical protein